MKEYDLNAVKDVLSKYWFDVYVLDDGVIEIEGYSKAGENLVIELDSEGIETIEDFASAFTEYVENFDLEEHVETLLNCDIKGTPSLFELVDDARDIEETLNNISDSLYKRVDLEFAQSR